MAVKNLNFTAPSGRVAMNSRRDGGFAIQGYILPLLFLKYVSDKYAGREMPLKGFFGTVAMQAEIGEAI